MPVKVMTGPLNGTFTVVVGLTEALLQTFSLFFYSRFDVLSITDCLLLRAVKLNVIVALSANVCLHQVTFVPQWEGCCLVVVTDPQKYDQAGEDSKSPQPPFLQLK